MFWANIKTYGKKLSGKDGLQSEMLGWWTDHMIKARERMALKCGCYIVVDKIKPKCLDDMWPDDLEKEALRKDMPNAYRKCARYMAAAYRKREAGNTRMAGIWQAKAEVEYNKLPEKWRW